MGFSSNEFFLFIVFRCKILTMIMAPPSSFETRNGSICFLYKKLIRSQQKIVFFIVFFLMFHRNGQRFSEKIMIEFIQNNKSICQKSNSSPKIKNNLSVTGYVTRRWFSYIHGYRCYVIVERKPWICFKASGSVSGNNNISFCSIRRRILYIRRSECVRMNPHKTQNSPNIVFVQPEDEVQQQQS